MPCCMGTFVNSRYFALTQHSQCPRPICLSFLQRMKKKYFILFADSDTLPARLEYFDSEKKCKNGQPPKK